MGFIIIVISLSSDPVVARVDLQFQEIPGITAARPLCQRTFPYAVEIFRRQTERELKKKKEHEKTAHS
jgi:hypothetical protein